MSTVTDVAIEIAAPSAAAAAPAALVVVHPIVSEDDEAYASCCGPAPTVSRAIARIRFAIAALVIVITSIYHGPPKGDATTNDSYSVSILADNLLHVAVVCFLCRGSFGEKKRALLAYCLLEILFIALVIYKLWIRYVDESTASIFMLMIFFIIPVVLYMYFYRIFIRYYYFLLDRERQTNPPQVILDEDSVSSIGDADLCTTKGVKKRSP